MRRATEGKDEFGKVALRLGKAVSGWVAFPSSPTAGEPGLLQPWCDSLAVRRKLLTGLAFPLLRQGNPRKTQVWLSCQ